MVHGIHGTHGRQSSVLPPISEGMERADETFLIQGAVFEVYRQMGAGFLEAVYQECLEIEFAKRGIAFRSQPTLSLVYKGLPLRQGYVPDFICFETVVLEIKALRALTPDHEAQLLNYLRASGLRVGLLANFGCAPKARVRRLVL